MSIDIEELLRAAGERAPAWSGVAEERAAGIARAIVESRARGPSRRRRRITVAALVVCALAAVAGAAWLHSRPGPNHQAPLISGPVPDYGDLDVRTNAPMGRNPFVSAGLRMRLRDVAKLMGEWPLLPGGRLPTDVWVQARFGPPRVMLDYARHGVRILEQEVDDCCTVDIRTTAGLRREAREHTGSYVTRIAGYPAVVAPPGTFAAGWRIQVAWAEATEVILLAPRRGHTAAELFGLIESLHRPRLRL